MAKTSQLQLEIKRTNTRINAIAKKYGTDSAVYRQAITGFTSKQYKAYTHITSKGVVQISSKLATDYKKGKQGLPREFMTRGMFTKMPTLSELERRGFEHSGLTWENWQKKSKEQRQRDIESLAKIGEDFNATKQNFYDLFTENEQRNVYEDLFKKKNDGSKKTYDELEEHTKMLEFFASHSRYYNPIDKIFEFKEGSINADDIPNIVKYRWIQ